MINVYLCEIINDYPQLQRVNLLVYFLSYQLLCQLLRSSVTFLRVTLKHDDYLKAVSTFQSLSSKCFLFDLLTIVIFFIEAPVFRPLKFIVESDLLEDGNGKYFATDCFQMVLSGATVAQLISFARVTYISWYLELFTINCE